MPGRGLAAVMVVVNGPPAGAVLEGEIVATGNERVAGRPDSWPGGEGCHGRMSGMVLPHPRSPKNLSE
jgi:hypothetical protein